jgi:hypothetical protein
MLLVRPGVTPSSSRILRAKFQEQSEAFSLYIIHCPLWYLLVWYDVSLHASIYFWNIVILHWHVIIMTVTLVLLRKWPNSSPTNSGRRALPETKISVVSYIMLFHGSGNWLLLAEVLSKGKGKGRVAPVL